MEQQFSLSWNNFHGNLTKGFSTLLANSEFVDVTLAVDDHLIQAHKIVLSICSPYFKKMFKMNPCQHPIVVLRGVTIKAMRDLLQFMYHGEVSVRQEELTSFISTAEILQIKGLTNKSNDDEAVETPKQEPPQSPNPVTPPNSQLTEPPVELPVEENIVEAVPSNNNITKLAAVKRKPDDATVSPDPSEYQNEKRTRVRERLKCEKHHQAGARSRLLNCDHKQRYSEPIITPPAAHLTDSIESTSQNNSDINGDHSMSAINLSDVKLESEDQNMYKMLQRRYSDSVLSNSQDFKKENGSPDEHYGDAKGNEEDGTATSETDEAEFLHDIDFPPKISLHTIVTIPQKEDGKKKYPQRSCRTCWRSGKRRDTRFMCAQCTIPLCKTSCFDEHLCEVLNVINKGFNNGIK